VNNTYMRKSGPDCWYAAAMTNGLIVREGEAGDRGVVCREGNEGSDLALDAPASSILNQRRINATLSNERSGPQPSRWPRSGSLKTEYASFWDVEERAWLGWCGVLCFWMIARNLYSKACPCLSQLCPVRYTIYTCLVGTQNKSPELEIWHEVE
jgi:hypothetical protein